MLRLSRSVAIGVAVLAVTVFGGAQAYGVVTLTSGPLKAITVPYTLDCTLISDGALTYSGSPQIGLIIWSDVGAWDTTTCTLPSSQPPPGEVICSVSHAAGIPNIHTVSCQATLPSAKYLKHVRGTFTMGMTSATGGTAWTMMISPLTRLLNGGM